VATPDMLVHLTKRANFAGDQMADELLAEMAAAERATATVDALADEIVAELTATDAATRAAQFASLADEFLAELAAEDAATRAADLTAASISAHLVPLPPSPHYPVIYSIAALK
jgi:hypothetical protein